MCLCARVTGDDDLESEFALTCGTCEFGLIPDDIGEDKDEGGTCNKHNLCSWSIFHHSYLNLKVDDVIDDLEDALGIDSSEENDSSEEKGKEYTTSQNQPVMR